MDNGQSSFGDKPGLEDAVPVTEPAPVVQSVDSTPGRRQRLRKPLLLAAPVIALALGLFFYLSGGRYQDTDNGYLQSGLVPVSASVSGPVIAVAVVNNQRVKAGDVLFRIDPAPYQAAVDEAEAELANARTQVSSLRANYREGEAGLQAAQARLAYATREAARQKSLLAEGISSQNQYDQAVLAAQTARQQIQTSVQQNAGVAATLTGSINAPTERQPGVQRAQAALERARLNLGYTVVRAAQDGIVTKVNQLQVGSYVAASKPVFTLAGTKLWVEGNFKEDQLAHMRVGQRATFRVDAFPDLKLTGRLASFSPGTGNSFSLLPAENATGNWVKVVQRLPVEFSIDQLPKDVPLHAGLSVEVTVDTGYKRHLFGSATEKR
ncbi:HlyD family secretion protein [Sphingobium sp. TB-6]|uniref:HlyD family secretion protein n=1 Tax=Sphingobium sp. TB-6 TaxID=2728850 RepID=UPI00146CAD1C|nr:HlyD family secretion protein [Sphingobium sp. TB-6]NML91803.1 HlyD family secretion protein [Sphingobium sp. TB-6]